jgi:long-chain fatty acid transport protein
MKLKHKLLYAASAMMLASALHATNGDNLIAVGPIARGSGGLSVAYPQDPISAVFANPAAMCFGPYCPVSEINVSITAFKPDVSASLTDSTGSQISSNSDEKVYPIPALGISIPLLKDGQDRLRFGFSAYGVSGLGVDYRGSEITGIFTGTGTSAFNPPIPLTPGDPWLGTGLQTELMIAKLAPALAYKITPNFSVGASLHFNYSELEINKRKDDGTTLGFQIGGIFTPVPNVFIGASYTNPQEITYEGVLAAGQPPMDPTYNDLALEAPEQFAIGISTELLDKRLVLGVDVRMIQWGEATGYSEFGWENQTVFAVGGQYAVIPEKFVIRAGYNYGNNPVKENQGFDGSFNPQTGMPNDVVMVQGTPFPRYYYEAFRIVGFPAIVEQHVTFGASWYFGDKFTLNVAYMHAFEETISESGISPLGTPTTITSTLSEDSFELGISWRF